MSRAELWWITLGAGIIIIAVVGALLVAILRSVQRITGKLNAAWIVGQSIANNTVHIDLLRRMSVVTDDVLASLELSVQSAERIHKADH